METTAEAGERFQHSSSMRRTPNQRRSRERVAHILDCATRLIAESGAERLRMSHLARAAEISIGSLYQYFPDKHAIIRTLAEQYGAEGRACIEAGLSDVITGEDLLEAFGDLVDTYYGIFLAEPVMRDIWSGTQADTELMKLELADSRKNAAILAEALRRVGTTADREALAASSFLIMHLGEATMRLAISVDRSEGDEIVSTYKRMALFSLDELIEN